MQEFEGAVWRAGCAQKANKVLEEQRFRTVMGGWWGVWKNGTSVLQAWMSRKGLGDKLYSLPWSRSEADFRDNDKLIDSLISKQRN